MTIEINKDTPFAADITATCGAGSGVVIYRLIIENGHSAALLYSQRRDRFHQKYWANITTDPEYRAVVGEIIMALAKQGRVAA